MGENIELISDILQHFYLPAVKDAMDNQMNILQTWTSDELLIKPKFKTSKPSKPKKYVEEYLIDENGIVQIYYGEII